MTISQKAINAAKDQAVIAALRNIQPLDDNAERISVKPLPRPENLPDLLDEAYYGPIGEAVRAIAPYTEADPAAIMATLIAYCGALVGPEPWCEMSGIKTNAAIFVLLVGETAKGRKGTSHHAAKALLGQLDKVRNLAGLGSGEGIVTELAAEDADNRHVMIVEEEFARLLSSAGRSGNTLSPTIRQMWDGEDLARTVTSGTVVAKDYHVSLIAHVTPSEQRSTMNQADKSNGFINRFMLVATHTTQMVTWDDQGQEDHPFRRALASAALADRASKVAERGRVHFASDAFPAWVKLREDGDIDTSRELLARLDAHMMRIALIYALIDNSEVITREHMIAAYAFTCYVRDTTNLTYPATDGDQLVLRIGQIIEKAGAEGITRTDLGKSCSNHIAADDRDRACAELIDVGLITEVREAGAGRTSVRYLATPKEAAQDAEEAEVAAEVA